MYANMENNHLGYCTIDVPSVTVRLTILCPMFRDVFSYILARLTDVGIHLVIMVGHCHVSVPCSTLCVQLCIRLYNFCGSNSYCMSPPADSSSASAHDG